MDIRLRWHFAKYRLWNPRALRFHRELNANQRLSRDELDALNWRKRKRLLEHAYNNVPYYKAKFQSVGLDPRDISAPDQYDKVPLLTRADLRQHFDDLVSRQASRKSLYVSSTGGSTGEPVKVLRDKHVPLEAMSWRTTGWWGVAPNADAAMVYRLPPRGPLQSLLNDLAWWPTRRIRIDASSMELDAAREFLRRFVAARPQIVWGYAGAVDHIASVVLDESFEVPAPKAISVTSSPITPIQRRRIERAFGAPVYDQYGTCEIFWLASQCAERAGLHISHDTRHIEFVDHGGRTSPTGELSDIVVTDLEDLSFPLIRYVVGDRGRALPGACSCGVTLPLMDQVRGRQTDLFRLPDGTVLAGDYLTTIFDDQPDAVRAFQVRLKRDGSILVLYVPDPAADGLDAVLSMVRAQLEKRTRGQVEVRFEPVDQIPHDRGKLRFVIDETTTPE